MTTACLAVLGTDSETEGEVKIPVTRIQWEDDLYSTGESSAVNVEDVASKLTVQQQQQQQLQELMGCIPGDTRTYYSDWA